MVIRKHSVQTPEGFEAFVSLPENAERRFEFIDGEIIEVPSNPYSSELSATIIFFLKLYAREQRPGHVTGEQAGYIVAGARLSPDAAFLSKSRQAELAREGYNPVAPDLAVEVVSPTDRESDLQKKLSLYMSAGVLVWVFRPVERVVEVHAPGQSMYTLGIDDTLNGGGVLPGFNIAVKDVFEG